MLPVWLEPSDPGLGPSSIVSASRWRTSRLGCSSSSSAADPLFHLAVGLDQLGGGVLTNLIAHQIGIQNPESRAQIGGFAAQPEDP